VNRATSFLLGALTVGALGIAGPRESSLVREAITIRVGDTLVMHYSVLTDTVLGVDTGRVIAKRCGVSKMFWRPWRLRPATHDSVVTNADSVSVNVAAPVGGSCTSEVPVPSPSDSGSLGFFPTSPPGHWCAGIVSDTSVHVSRCAPPSEWWLGFLRVWSGVATVNPATGVAPIDHCETGWLDPSGPFHRFDCAETTKIKAFTNIWPHVLP
jgi:hypothetical protein